MSTCEETSSGSSGGSIVVEFPEHRKMILMSRNDFDDMLMWFDEHAIQANAHRLIREFGDSAHELVADAMELLMLLRCGDDKHKSNIDTLMNKITTFMKQVDERRRRSARRRSGKVNRRSASRIRSLGGDIPQRYEDWNHRQPQVSASCSSTKTKCHRWHTTRHH